MSTRLGVIRIEVRKWPTWDKGSEIVDEDHPFWEGFDHVYQGGSIASCIYCAWCCYFSPLLNLRHPSLSLPLDSAMSSLVVRMLVIGRLGWVLSVRSLFARWGQSGWAHREKLELIVRYQRPLVTPPPPTPTGWGSEGTLSPPAPTGRRSGGIHIKFTGDLEEKNCQGRTTFFSNDAVLLRFPTRSRLEIMHQ